MEEQSEEIREWLAATERRPDEYLAPVPTFRTLFTKVGRRHTMSLLARVDSRGSNMRCLAINVNNRCPLRCRHCSVGFSSDYAGNSRKIDADELVRTIAAVDPSVYNTFLLAGGEPSLDPPLLRVAIDACKTHGLLSAIVTAPVWASKPEAADRFLDRIGGLDVLILSYDRYHLEFLDIACYETAVRAAAGRRIDVFLHVTHSNEAEMEELLARVASIRPLCRVSNMRTVPIGNAANPSNVEMEYTTVDVVDDLARIPRGCVLGNAFIDEGGAVHGCCWSKMAARSPFSVSNGAQGLKKALEDLEESELFQAVRAHGFLGALTPKAKEALVQLVKGRPFTNECHICLAAMNEGNEQIWDEHIAAPEEFFRSRSR